MGMIGEQATFYSYHYVGFLSCSLCVLMMGSEYTCGEGSDFQLLQEGL